VHVPFSPGGAPGPCRMVLKGLGTQVLNQGSV
jgi:hypothetical protein